VVLHNRRKCILLLAIGSFILGSAIFGILQWRSKPSKSNVIKFEIEAPEGQSLGASAPSPDGKQLAYISWRIADRRPSLWIRRLESATARPVPGIDGASSLCWSPDSLKLAVADMLQIKSVDLESGLIRVVATADQARMGDWGESGMLLFSALDSDKKRRVYAVPAAGGSLSPILTFDENRKEKSQVSPCFLPGSDRFLYFSAAETDTGIYVASLDGKFKKILKAGGGSGFPFRDLRSGKCYLWFWDGRACAVQQLDPDSVELLGESQALSMPANLMGPAANSFLMLYRTRNLPRISLVWYSRSGQELDALSAPETIYGHELSPDGRQIAWELIHEPDNFSSIWVRDLVRGVKLHFANPEGWQYNHRFWPDGSKIAFVWYRGNPGRYSIAIRPVSESGTAESVHQSDERLFLNDVSPDGENLIFEKDGPPSTLWVLPLAGEHPPILYRSTKAHNSDARFSPDGRWIAYTSSDSGRPEIQVQDFAPRSKSQQYTQHKVTVVSSNGGAFPRWSRDGKELFYLAPDRSLMRVPVETTGRFTAGRPEKLFELPVRAGIAAYRNPYAVAADAQKFLIAMADELVPRTHIIAIRNWMAMLAGNTPSIR
jgi:eukaryotic-like serine/threonine-protein kinase